MAIGFFMKTFRGDLKLARYALELLHLHWQSEHPPEVVVMLDEDCRELVMDWNFPFIRYEFVEPWPDGYCHAMAMKACADLFMLKSDPIFLLDADTMLRERSSAERLMPGGRPVLVYQRWPDRDQVNRVAREIWVPAIARSSGLALSADWMVHPERLYWRSTFAFARELVEYHCRRKFLEAVRSDCPYDWHRFSEHPMTLCENEMLPMVGAMLEPQRYDIRRLEEANFAGGFTQIWSHAPLDGMLDDLLRSTAT
jgi:hypothetical protein